MPEQPQGAQANAPVTDEGIALAEQYDKATDERLAAQEDTEIGEGVKLVGAGAVVVGDGQLGQTSMFVGKNTDDDAEFVRGVKGLDRAFVGAGTDTENGPREATSSGAWTAQSARAYVEENALDVPGQTFTVDELPDPRVVSASTLPSFQIPGTLVVEEGVTDTLNTGQERGVELGSGNRVAAPAGEQANIKAAQSREAAEKRTAKADAGK